MIDNIFDSHAHYDDEKFNNNRYEVIDNMFANGICGIINCGCDYESSLDCISLSHKYNKIFAAIGIHPHESCSVTNYEFEKTISLLDDEKVVAIGEIGLDYHYDFSPRKNQIEMFEQQVILSKEFDIPIIVHDREAHEDIYKILKKYHPKGVVHCFSGSVELAIETIKLGMYIGIGGSVTFKNAVKPVEVAKYVPFEKLLLETDAPYMAPVPMRGKICDSQMIEYTALKIAEIKGVKAQELVNLCTENTKELFKI